MRALLLLLASCAAASAGSMTVTTFTAGSTPQALLVIMGGQSNMAGFGAPGDEVPANLQGEMNDIYYWRNIEPEGAPVFGWAEYHAGTNSQPVDVPDPDGQQWGPEAEFARQFRLAYPTTKLFMVKNSLSGSQLEKSEVFLGEGAPSNDWHPESTAELYEGTQGLVEDAIAAMDADFSITDFRTLVLWMQGEADAAYAETSPNYYDNLGDLITALRAEWGLGGAVQFIAGRIQPVGWTYNGPVRHAFARMAVDVPGVKMVDTDDLPLADGIHYDPDGQQGLGLRFWEAYANTRSTTAISLPSTFEWEIEEQLGNGTTIGAIAPSNSPDPTETFALLSGETDGFAVNYNTGVLTVADGSELVFADDDERVFTVQASNGINTATTTVTVTLTEADVPTDVTGRLARFDPDNATFYTLDGSNYEEMSDTYGDGNEVVQSIGGKPAQATFPGTAKDALNPDGGDSLYRDPDAALFDDDDEDAVLACVVRPTSGPSGGKIIMAVLSGFAECRLTIFYNYTTEKFGFHALNTLGTLNTMTTTNTFADDTTYRVVLKKVGATITLWVDEAEQATSSHGDLEATILSTGQDGGFTIAGQGLFGGEFVGYIGPMWFIKGNPSGPEMDFLNDDLSDWLGL